MRETARTVVVDLTVVLTHGQIVSTIRAANNSSSRAPSKASLHSLQSAGGGRACSLARYGMTVIAMATLGSLRL